MTTPSQNRLKEVVPAAVAAMQQLARDLHLTNDELMATLAFISEVAEADELVLLSDVLGVSRVVDDQTHADSDATENNVLGPFYIPDAPWIANPGSIIPDAAAGERVELTGRVTTGSGEALGDAVVDVWQADADGHYSNEYPDGPKWAFRARQKVDDTGSYRITTVRPRHYTVKHDGPVGRLLKALGRHPWRPAHVHFMVTAPGHKALVTQAYVAGSPHLDDDAIDGVKEDLIRTVEDGRLSFDIVLARD